MSMVKVRKTLTLLLLGDSNVGKSSILDRYVDGVFDYNCIQTIGLEYKSKREDECTLKVWSVCGGERYVSISRSFYNTSSVILLVFDITRKTTFDNLEMYLKDIVSFSNNNPNTKFILVGTKSDLSEKKQVSEDDIRQFMKDSSKSIVNYYEISSKTGQNIDKLFKEVCRVGLEAKYTISVPVIEEEKSVKNVQSCSWINNLCLR